MKANQDKQVMDSLKNEYHNIPVPEAARERVLMGIQEAKREPRQENQTSEQKSSPKNHVVIHIAKTTGMTAAAALMAITVLANSSASIANAMEKIPVVGPIAKVVTFRTYEDKQNNHEAEVKIPQITIDGQKETAVNKSIEDYANRLIAEYEANLAADQGEGHYQLYSEYDVVFENEKYLSLRIRSTVSMASGAEYVKIFTVDKETGDVVTLSQLLNHSQQSLTAISENIMQQMTQQMANDESKQYFYQSEYPESDFKGLTGDENYYFNQDGNLVIAFDEYQVAPGSMGAVEFVIPQSVVDISE